jgi:UTP-glucose-1-phosphate uridylyltransferase
VISGKEIFAKLNKVRPDANGEFQLTTAFDMLAVEKKLFGLIVNKKIKVMDIGNKEGYAQANLFFTEENLH